LIWSVGFQQGSAVGGTPRQRQVPETGPHLVPGYLPVVRVVDRSCSHRSSAHNLPISIAWWKKVSRYITRPGCTHTRRVLIVAMGMNGVGKVDIADVAQVYLDDAPAGDGDLAAGMRPDDVVPGSQRGIDAGKDHAPVEPALPDGGVNHPGCIGSFQTDLDFLAAV